MLASELIKGDTFDWQGKTWTVREPCQYGNPAKIVCLSAGIGQYNRIYPNATVKLVSRSVII